MFLIIITTRSRHSYFLFFSQMVLSLSFSLSLRITLLTAIRNSAPMSSTLQQIHCLSVPHFICSHFSYTSLFFFFFVFSLQLLRHGESTESFF